MTLWATPLFSVPQPESFRVTSIGAFVAGVGILLFLVGVIFFFVLLIWGGLEWITSGGDKAKIETARGRITQGLVGLSIMSLTLAVVILLEQFFGITIIGDSIPLPTAF